MAPFDHAGQHGVAAVQHSVQVDLHRSQPVVRVCGGEFLREHGLGSAVAGVVDQHVDGARLGNRRVDGGPVGHVERHGHCGHPVGHQGFDDLVGPPGT